jgi:hypothetical protein
MAINMRHPEKIIGMDKMKPSTLSNIAFYYWFAKQDLMDKRSWRTTAAILLNLILVFWFITVLLGAPAALELIRKNHLKQNPTALSVEFDKGAGAMVDIKLHEKEKYEKAFNDNPNLGFRSLSFFRNQKLEFFLPDGSTELRGRTVDKNDLVINAAGFSDKFGQDLSWIAISNTLKTQLVGALDPTKEFITIRSATTGNKKTIKVAGYYSSDFDSSGFFMISEKAALDLKNEPNPKSKWITTGPLPKSWMVKMLPDKVNEYLDKYSLRRPSIETRTLPDGKDAKCWRLDSTTDSGEKLSDWKDHLFALGSHMKENHGEETGDFKVISSFDNETSVDGTKKESATTFDIGVLYVKDLENLGPCIKELKKNGCRPLNPEIEAQLREINASTEWIKTGLNVISIFIIFLGAINTGFLEFFRLRQKIPEIGLLRSIGITDGKLLFLCLFECFFLLAFSFIASIVFSFITIWSIKASLLPWANWGDIFNLQYFGYLSCFGIFNFFITMGSSYFGSLSSRNSCPADSLCKAG